MADDWPPFDCDWPEFTGRPIHEHYSENPLPLPQEIFNTSASQNDNSQQLQTPVLPLFSEQFGPMLHPVSTNEYRPSNILQEQLQKPLPVMPQYVDQFNPISPASSSQYAAQLMPIPTTASLQCALQFDPLPTTSTSQYAEEINPMLVSSEQYTEQFKQVPLSVAPQCTEFYESSPPPVLQTHADSFKSLPATDTSQYAQSFEPISVTPQYSNQIKHIPATVTSQYAESFEPKSVSTQYTDQFKHIPATVTSQYAESFEPKSVSTQYTDQFKHIPATMTSQYAESFEPTSVSSQYTDQIKHIPMTVTSQYAENFEPIYLSPQYTDQIKRIPATVTSQYAESFEPKSESTQYTDQIKQIPATVTTQYAESFKPIYVSPRYTAQYKQIPATVTSQYSDIFEPISVSTQYRDQSKHIPAKMTSQYVKPFENTSVLPPYAEKSVHEISPTCAKKFKASEMPISSPITAQSQTITISFPQEYAEQFKADPLPFSIQSNDLMKPSTSDSCLPISLEFKPPQRSTSVPAPNLQPPIFAFPQLRSEALPALPKGSKETIIPSDNDDSNSNSSSPSFSGRILRKRKQVSYFKQKLSRETPREIRNKAEKLRRDKLNQSIAELASMVPPVLASKKKVDKTGVLRYTAHYLRAHQYVFGDSLDRNEVNFSPNSINFVLSLMNGFLLTTTYKGIIVVISHNVAEYLGYSELELLGQSIFIIVHEEDHQHLREQLMPKPHFLGPNGELLVPEDPEEKEEMMKDLATEKRQFVIRFKKLTPRLEPMKYVTCHVNGSLRKADGASKSYHRCCQMVRRVRARVDSNYCSGNDVVFVGLARPIVETFRSESEIESFRMEYKTRHSIDGEIIHVEQKISLVAGYMTHEVKGVNAMNFMHKDDVRWVIFALREMYDQHRLVGESCYRLMAKNGQFLYMRTRGTLEVDLSSRAVTTFICTNTVVDEVEGRYLINEMKQRFNMLINNNQDAPLIEDEQDDCLKIPVEDPKQLEKVILHLVTNLPSPAPENDNRSSTPDNQSPSHLAIIPPEKDRIVNAIEKSYSVIKVLDKPPELMQREIESNLNNICTTPTSQPYSNNGNNIPTPPKTSLQSFGFTFPYKAVLREPLDRNTLDYVFGAAQLVDDPGLGTSVQSAPKRPNDCNMTDIFYKRKMGKQKPAATHSPIPQLEEGLFTGLNNILGTGGFDRDT